MLKAQHYRELAEAGLPVPIYGVFDSSCLSDERQAMQLSLCVDHILSHGSSLIGVRTEPKGTVSPLGNYPHYMPLRSLDEVRGAVQKNESTQTGHTWWYLVNEAFVDYCWNAVVRVTQEAALPGHWLLDGEVNFTDNLPLRPALTNMANVLPVRSWKGDDPGGLRKEILKSGLVETWIEVSKVRTATAPRLVFWGLRGTRLMNDMRVWHGDNSPPEHRKRCKSL